MRENINPEKVIKYVHQCVENRVGEHCEFFRKLFTTVNYSCLEYFTKFLVFEILRFYDCFYYKFPLTLLLLFLGDFSSHFRNLSLRFFFLFLVFDQGPRVLIFLKEVVIAAGLHLRALGSHFFEQSFHAIGQKKI